jgi:hypothetical protein
VQVAAADSHGIRPYLDFAGAGIFNRCFGESELALRDKFGYEHLQPL